jgi:hypothetical protein
MSIASQYGLRNVFWGRELPKILLYNANWYSFAEWQFSKNDNFRMEISVSRAVDSEVETEQGMMRQRIRGYRMQIEFTVNNIENRDLIRFLRRMWLANHIIIVPHWGSMVNPSDNTYNFEVLLTSDFEPKYFDGRFIGHQISWSFMSKDLLNSIPDDKYLPNVIPATTKRVGGATVADEQTSVTYPSEKMMYGGWEVSEDDYREIAYVESPASGEEDPYGAAP